MVVNFMELLSIGKFAKTVGVTTTTLRRMHQSGELIPAHISMVEQGIILRNN